jgi:hypothetical protein
MKAFMLLVPAVLGGLLAATPIQAQVFKCKGPNGVVYQDGPCEEGSAVDTRSPRGVASPKSTGKGESASSGTIQTKPTHPVVPERMRR